MIRTTTWRPDTCGCRIEYEWDDLVSQDLRVHTGSRILIACPAHIGITDPQMHYIALADENTRKNISLGRILVAIPSAAEDQLDERGQVVGKRFRVGFDPAWAFDSQRVLVFTLPAGFTPGDKATITADLDLQFGAGKTQVN